MKIGMILDKGFPPDTRVENEAKTLIAHGHEVILFCWNFRNQAETENIDGIQVHRYKLSQKLFDFLSPLAFTFPVYFFFLTYYVKKFLSNYKPDVIHIHDMVAAEPVYKVANRSTPIVLDLHENRPEIMKTYTHINSGFGKFLVDVEKWRKKQQALIGLADKLIVVTEEAKNEILDQHEINKENIYVVPNAVMIENFFNYQINNEIIEKYQSDFVVLYLGSTGLRRGTETAIHSIKILKNKINNIKLVLVGKSRDDAKLKKLTENLNIKDNVVFEGWQNVTLFPSYILVSDVCISPLLRNLHHDTTYANKLFQYMSLGKPTVVSDCPAQREVVEKENCGLVHKADDPNDLADKIEKLYYDKKLSEKLGENGKLAVLSKYNWTETGKDLVNLYETLEKGTNHDKKYL